MVSETQHTHHKSGTPEHYRHYINEFERIKALADNERGAAAEELYFELDGITMILEEYEP